MKTMLTFIKMTLEFLYVRELHRPSFPDPAEA